MSILDGLLQGLLQGITEFLPVSSSGHLTLYQHFTGNSGDGSLFFTLMLHLGTLAAVIAAYYEDLWGMLKEVGRMIAEIVGGRFHWKAENPDRKLLYMLFFACLPMLLLVFLNGFVEKIAQDNDIVVEGACFLFTSLLLFLACKAPVGHAKVGKMRPKHALIIGGFQALAAMPGISRSGSTISTGMVMGFDRSFMAKFSFLLGIPAILGGVVFEAGDAMKEGIKVEFWPLFIGMLAAAVSGYFCIRLIRWMLKGNKFIIFAWYTLAVGVVVLIIGIVEHLSSAKTPDPASSLQAVSMVNEAAAVLRGAL